jgi:hypothetical protein
VRLIEPLEGHNRIAPSDAAIGVDPDQALEVRRASEELFDARDDIALVEAVRRHAGRDCGKAREWSHRQSQSSKRNDSVALRGGGITTSRG